MKVPCKDCHERHMGCHAECSIYKEFQAECEKVRSLRELEHQKDRHTVENVHQIRKRTGYYKKGGKCRWQR